MKTVADYDVVLDEGIKLGMNAGQNHDKTIDLEVKGIDTEIRSVLSWVLDPGQSGVKYEVFIINGLGPNQGSTLLGSFEAMDPSRRAFQEVIGPGILTATDNKLKINVTSGDAWFSDMVLLFQVDLP